MQFTYSLLADYTTLVFHNGRLYCAISNIFGNSPTKNCIITFFDFGDLNQTVKSKHPPITMAGVEPALPHFALPLSYTVVLLLI